MKRLIAVGDIHGRLSKLNNLMNKVRPHPDDQIVFLGDYIDRGPQSKEVIDYLLNFAQAFPQTMFLRGNHEQLFLDVLVKKGLRHGPTLRETSLVYRVYRITSYNVCYTKLLRAGDAQNDGFFL